MADGWLRAAREGGRLRVEAGGDWTLAALVELDHARQSVSSVVASEGGAAEIDVRRIAALDTAGAWLLDQLGRDLEGRGWQVELAGLAGSQAGLLAAVQRAAASAPAPAVEINPLVRLVANLGRGTLAALDEARRLLSFYGQTIVAFGRVLVRPSRFRMTSLVHHVEQTFINALPIVGLIAFLVGIVMAYQGADQLRRFGAEIYTINLLGITILREIGIMLTAIVVAGRTGSAFTAEIGTMMVNQEVDAMRTLGLDPIEILVLPRLVALMIALPLLTFFADILGLVGGALMSDLVLGISPDRFIVHLQGALWPTTFWVGMIKAPFFAYLIGMVGCYEGLNVSGSAESVGRMTTRSVVVGIFLVIVFDALFSILFSTIGW
jgi:phospholipid/cholesterol/gamma-HCH transport system permease protein